MGVVRAVRVAAKPRRRYDGHRTFPPSGVEPITVDATIFSVGLLGIVAVGTLVAGRQPANPIGWLLCAFGLVQVIAPLCYLYAIVGFSGRAQQLPGAAVAAWVSAWIWIPVIAVLGLALLLFPSGRSPSARWRLAAWAAIAGTGASLALGAALWSQRGLGLLTVGDEFPGWKVKAMGLSSSGAWRSGGLR